MPGTADVSIVVNCEKVDFHSTLGVAGVLINICEELAKCLNLIFVLKDREQYETPLVRDCIQGFAGRVLIFDEAKDLPELAQHIELLPHHFQQNRFSSRSILICHDLHVYDIPWKYPRVDNIREGFRRNLTTASAVITEFPRTYYEVEKFIGSKLDSLFIIESPLMLDTSLAWSQNEPQKGELALCGDFLLYPAQLQAHKNHRVLIEALHHLRSQGNRVNLICPGSNFDPTFTQYLEQLVSDYGLEDSVKFPGHVSERELIDLYKACAAVVVPSLAEGGAYVAMEAIAAGKPVAVNDILAARMHVRSFAGSVIWFDATSAGATVEAVIQSLSQEDAFQRNSHSRNVIGGMKWSAVADKMVEIVKWLNGQRDKPRVKISKSFDQIRYT